MNIEDDNLNIEIPLLLEAIYQKYGYDFRGYSRAHIKRRILHRLAMSDIESVSLLQHKILTDKDVFHSILDDFSINVTEMFRDPQFYLSLRAKVIPLLKTYPHIKIWHAGCASGEEAYSMAILLHEEGLIDRTLLYATDCSEKTLESAKSGIIPMASVRQYTQNYQKAGGKFSFADYYFARYDSAKLDDSLKEKIVFAGHNLVTDGVFGEMHLIICRNVLIYFNKQLQERVVGLFKESLCPGGFLCLGSKESLQFSSHAAAFDVFAKEEKIYRRKYP